nr:MAG TPA: hypothetical protein [Caudoviricetes sp.]
MCEDSNYCLTMWIFILLSLSFYVDLLLPIQTIYRLVTVCG